MDDAAAGTSLQVMTLDIPQFRGNSFHVVRMEGREAISSLYTFQVNFTCPNVLDPESATGKPAMLTLTTGGETFNVAGVIIEFSCDDPVPWGDFAYRLIIGPRLGLLDLSRQNQVYGTDNAITVADIIDGKLTNSLSNASTSRGETVLIDYEKRLSGAYTGRNHVVQFDESDLNFVARTCEHVGVFYFFEHSNQKENAVFGDANVAFDNAATLAIPFRMTRGHADDLAVSSFIATCRPVPKTVYVRDYDDTQAGAQLLASTQVDSTGIGAVVEYGQNFNSVDSGTRLAQVRAEERAAEKLVFRGVSTAPQLRPGYFFTLSGHPNHAMNGKYVVISAQHRAGDARSVKEPYENTFECIKFEVPYRPKRATRRPTAAGLFNATIDSAGDGSRADVDASGRYKIRHYYDESNSAAGHASTFVRKAQPHAGKSDTGMHFPLLKDTEVMVSYVNGDPDRPLIVGAVPNSLTPSVGTQSNSTINRIRSTSGGLFELNDGSAAAGGVGGNPYLRLMSQDFGQSESSGSSYIRLGAYISGDESNLLASAQSPAATVTSSTTAATDYSSSQGYQQASIEHATSAGTLTTDQQQGNTQSNKTQKMTISSTARSPASGGIMIYSSQDLQITTVGAAYMNFKAGHTTMVSTGDGAYHVPAGQFTLDAAKGITITAGSSGGAADINLTAYNYINQKAYGPLDEVTYGDSYKNVHGNATELFLGTKNTWVTDAEISGKLAASMTLFMGLSSTIKLSLELNLALAGIISVLGPFTMGITIGWKFDIIVGADTKIVTGGANKTVLGQDMSEILSGLKIVGADDLKIVTGVDFKTVNLDSKLCQFFFEQKGVELKGAAVEAANKNLVAHRKVLVAKLESLRTKITDADITI